MESSQTEAMGRREFIGAAAAAFFAGVVITMTGCSEDDTTGPGDGGKSGTIENNHGHSVSITKEQLEAGTAVTLTLSGGGHTHSFPLSADDIASIKGGAGIHNRETGPGGDGPHTHRVHFM